MISQPFERLKKAMHLPEKCTRLQTQNSAYRVTDSLTPRLKQVTNEATLELVNCDLFPDNQPDPSFEQVTLQMAQGGPLFSYR